jgi:hypothetical protein
VLLKWPKGWLASSPGERAGPVVLACRPATVIDWLHRTLYRPLNRPTGGAGCGFCLSGNSAGSSAIAYAMAFYGLDRFVDGMVLTGGPPHTAIAEGCMRDDGLAYPGETPHVIDASYGFQSAGPCERADPSWRPTWKADSLDLAGRDYLYPSTRILLMVGAEDDSGAAEHQARYLEVLRRAKDPAVEQETIPGMTHAVTASSEGLARMREWFVSG